MKTVINIDSSQSKVTNIGQPRVGVPEAPDDGNEYSRKNNSWVVSTGGSGGISDAPIDGNQYLRQDGSWVIGTSLKGDDGASAYQVALDNGFVGTEQQWLDSLKGDTGPQGPQGIQGEQGPIGLTGPKGDTGEQGTQGLKGEEGLSAYQVAVQQGFIGTEAQWLESLKGEQGDVGPQGVKGDTGDTGPQGLKGDAGDTGPQGIQGPAGAPGTDGTSVTITATTDQSVYDSATPTATELVVLYDA